MKTRTKILLNLILTFSFVGCSNQPMQVQSTRSSHDIEPTTGAIATLEISPSPAFTLVPDDNTPERILLTILPNESKTTILELYSDDVCKLPCWWGIKPGEISIEDAYQRFEHLGEFRDMTSLVDTMNHIVFTVIPPKDIDLYNEGQWHFALVESGGLIKGITAGATRFKPFPKPTLAQILAEFGKPEEIWVSVQEHQIGPPSFHLDLYYPNIGVLVISKGNANPISRLDNSIDVSICPQNIQTVPNNQVDNKPILFHLWSPDESFSHHKLRTTHLDDEDNYRLLATLTTQMDEEKFYNTYKHLEITTCFDLTWEWNP